MGTSGLPDNCEKLPGLTRRQVKVCRRNSEIMDSVRLGALRALRECQWQFRSHRWNCSLVLDRGTVGEGTKESSFLHAVTAAGVAHAVTRACSAGRLERCGCDRSVRGTTPEGYKWAGCSDNVAYGSAFSRAFVDARDIRAVRGAKAAWALLNLHNNEAGRK
ncbi:WNT4, partial [Cordylochernes scorpioides]